jgi:hypothetical protein
MSLVATITLAWAAVHTWAGIQNVDRLNALVGEILARPEAPGTRRD